jgi:hypothetical protein
MNSNYTLTVNYVDPTKNSTTLPTKAVYNSLSDQTVYDGWTEGTETGLYDIPLFDVS